MDISGRHSVMHCLVWLSVILSVLFLHRRAGEAVQASGTALHDGSPQKPVAVVAIIIDDFGDHRSTAEAFLEIDSPLTYSILPGRPMSQWTAKRASAKGREIMLHLPMEPHRYPEHNPGPMAVLSHMSERDIRQTVKDALMSVPGVIGVDNHMGSLITEDPRVMRIVLEELMARRLFYIDSLTTAKSVAYDVGLSLGMHVAKNRVFLDNERRVAYTEQRLKRLGDIALRHGRAIAIGHVARTTAEALQQGIPELEARGVCVVPVSRLVTQEKSP